jgi:hypothetical protein
MAFCLNEIIQTTILLVQNVLHHIDIVLSNQRDISLENLNLII